MLVRLREEVAKSQGAAANGEQRHERYGLCLGYEKPTLADAIASRNPCRIIALSGWGRRRREGSSFCLLPDPKALVNYAHAASTLPSQEPSPWNG